MTYSNIRTERRSPAIHLMREQRVHWVAPRGFAHDGGDDHQHRQLEEAGPQPAR
jgi:hypothetical protein